MFQTLVHEIYSRRDHDSAIWVHKPAIRDPRFGWGSELKKCREALEGEGGGNHGVDGSKCQDNPI
jgi:hypothetical protein